MTTPSPPVTSCARGDVTVAPILGMHRSGTSMFTRALQLMGLALGEPLMAPQPDNPKGFWENEFFYDIDVRILHAMQRHVSGYGRHDELLAVPAHSAQVNRTDANLRTIEGYLDGQFTDTPVWGWKDPRTVLLFPYWLMVLVELGFRRVRPMIITRHPAAVMHSLSRRTDLDGPSATVGIDKQTLALEIWIAYSHILLDIATETGAYISVHEWFLEPASAADELRRAATVIGHLDTGTGLQQALDWVDPGAVHHQQPEVLSGPLGEEALDLYGDLLARARQQRAAWRGQVDGGTQLSGPWLAATAGSSGRCPAATAS